MSSVHICIFIKSMKTDESLAQKQFKVLSCSKISWSWPQKLWKQWQTILLTFVFRST